MFPSAVKAFILPFKALMTDIHQILKSYWKYNSFRGLQEPIIQSVLDKKDTLALLPTGGGKSICFQVPSLATEGLCIVISPLIALMKDQVENLRRRNITAFAIHSGMSRKEVISTLQVAASSNCKFLYVSPERLETSLFKTYLPALPVNLIAVDEAHCISQWGYDFRPAYLRIIHLRNELPDVPVLALTASATPLVQDDICNQLSFKNYQIFRQSFERPNISYSAFNTTSKINKILQVLQNVKGTSIIYCRSRKKTKEISDLLNMHNISAAFYHAGLNKNERNRIQEEWLQNSFQTIVCTNAFGMGIDKPDVRCVIHADVPDCIENYYQEAGRAGRDGKKAYAVLLYNQKELGELKEFSEIRYPSMNELKRVYDSVMNYLQIPSGSGEGLSYNFDLVDFIKRFRFGTKQATYGLQSLAQLGLFVINEPVFNPSVLQFTCTKDDLYAFEQLHPELELLIKTLLRNYQGIFDQPVNIQENNIAPVLKKHPEEIISNLKKLQAFGIVSYSPQKDKPQLFLLQNRVRLSDLFLNLKSHKERKKIFEDRVREFLRYIGDTTKCRSKMIGSYFGDNKMIDCGKCDNCLNGKKTKLTTQEFASIHTEILMHINVQPLLPQELFEKLVNVKKEKAWEVIHFLEAENKIDVNPQGVIAPKN